MTEKGHEEQNEILDESILNEHPSTKPVQETSSQQENSLDALEGAGDALSSIASSEEEGVRMSQATQEAAGSGQISLSEDQGKAESVQEGDSEDGVSCEEEGKGKKSKTKDVHKRKRKKEAKAKKAAKDASARDAEVPTSDIAASKKARPDASREGAHAHSIFGTRTDVGLVREHNEDSLTAIPPLFAVADGMGGHAAGEVASELAIEALQQYAPSTPDADALGRAVEVANLKVMEAATADPQRRGMGTTMTAAVMKGSDLVIAQVGDSRAYLLHQGTLQQITRDHSLMNELIEKGMLTEEEARFHPNRSIITRALGSNPTVLPDLYRIAVEAGDRLLLCSDGLSGLVQKKKLQQLLSSVRSPQECADRLVKEALDAGGHDNVTVIVVDAEVSDVVGRKKVKRRAKGIVIAIIVALVLLLGGAAFGLHYVTNNLAYLTDENGKVAVYRGIPGDVLGMKASTLDKVTDVNTDELTPTLASRLKDGHVSASSLEEAYAMVDEYEEELAMSKGASGEQPATPEQGQQPVQGQPNPSAPAEQAKAEGGQV